MRSFALLCLAPLLAFADPPDAGSRGDAAKGKVPYKTFCASCHGEKGDGKGPASAGLDPKPTPFTEPATAARMTWDWVFSLVKDGGPKHQKSPQMVPWGGVLKDDQLQDITAYTLTLKAAPKAK